MSKQSRAMKAQQVANEKADAAIEAAYDRVLSRPQRGKPLDEGLLALAPAIKEGRENGEAWWRIAHRLGLPGSADSVAKGKAGAALARRVYAAAFGALPAREPKAASAEKPARQRKPRLGAERNEEVRRVKAQRRADREQKVRQGSSILDLTLSDDQLRDVLKGRHIVWSINLNSLDGKGDSWSDDEATIHPRWMQFGKDKEGNRTLYFKTMEVMKGVKGDGRFQPGVTRTVRLSAIHTVK